MIRVIWGEDPFALAAEERRILDEVVDPAWRSVNLTVFEGTTAHVAEVANAARTASFFGNRLVVVRDCPWFSPRRSKKSDGPEGPEPGDGSAATPDSGAGKAMAELLREGLPEGCHLLLVVPCSVNRTLLATKALLEAAARGRAQVREFPGPDPFKPERTVAWLVERAREIGTELDRAAADLLVGRLGQDKYLLDNELAKLSSYAAGRPVRSADVALLSPPGESDVFELLDAVAARRLPEAVAHLRRLTLHDHPLKILATMVTLVRTWLQIKLMAEGNASEEDIGRAVRWHPFRVRKTQAALRRWNSGHLTTALGALSEAEQALKSSGLPDELVMERLLARLAAL